MPTIAQLTDLHLLSNPDGKLKDVPVRGITESVVAELKRRIDEGHEDFDRIVITGDLAHDESRETYVILRTLLGDLFPRCLLLPGNHDNRPALREVFPELFGPHDEFLTFSIAIDNWRLIGLDSHLPGEVEGRLGGAQLDWLEQELRTHAEQPTVLFMHHPPFDVGAAWVDALGLQDANDLLRRVGAATQVKALCAGHVHQEFDAESGDRRWLTTPSASLQFKPGADEFELDTKPAGFRIVRLRAEFESEVVRLQN